MINDLIGKSFSDDPVLAYGPDFYSCYGLLVEVFKRYGIEIPKVNIAVLACENASNREIEKRAALEWEEIKEPEVPCGVLIRSSTPGFANHIGIYIGKNRMIHIVLKRNVVVDRLSDWKHKIIGYYKYVGNSNNNI